MDIATKASMGTENVKMRKSESGYVKEKRNGREKREFGEGTKQWL
jgi:hypothetical protein